MSIERVRDTALVRLPAGLCFYESRAGELVEALSRLAEELHRQTTPKIKGVLILQEGAADDRSAAWLAELAGTCLFADLVQRIDTWRWLLSLIRNSPVPWVFAAAADCQGSTWELALSCQRRYWYADAAYLGFPSITAGAFPPGGVLESLSKRAGRTRERWQARPIMQAAEALEDGLVHFCSDAARPAAGDETQPWLQVATTMFQEMLGTNPRSGVRDLRKKRPRDDFEPVDLQSRRAAYEQLGNVWRHERAGSGKEPSAWDYCWQLVKERSKLKQNGDLGRLICLIASRHLLSTPYRAWVEAYLIAQRGRIDLVDTAVCLPPVVVDLDYVAPPTDVLVRLLKASLRLVFVAAEGKDLTTALNLLYSRLERAVGAATAQALWEQSATWYQGVCDDARSLVLRFAVDDRFIIAAGRREISFLRLEGNGTGARPGLVEWCSAEESAELPPLAQAILPLVADGLVKTKRSKGAPFPLAVHIRSLFFEEMLRIAPFADGDLGAVADGLKASGWRFAGDDDAWDRFLRTRGDAYPFDAGLASLGARTVERSHWEIGSWKHAKALAKRVGSGEGRKWNATAVSLHLAIFLGLLADAVVASGRLADAGTADYLCGVALGLPPVFGTPLTFLRQRGRRRIEHYAAAHWPLMQREGSTYGRSFETRI